uniref:Uncharacterized protein n=1 Tax=viral metagenome TaxID=1070528 RepID=A0A6C0C764_9ZZZZ
METIINSDIFNHHIKQLLDPINLFNLLITCKLFSKYLCKEDLEKNAVIQFGNELSKIFGDKHSHIFHIIQKWNAVISGSIIIKSIIGSKWNDIDLKVHITRDTTLENVYEIVSVCEKKPKITIIPGSGVEILIDENIIINLYTADSCMSKYDEAISLKFPNKLMVTNIKRIIDQEINVNIFECNIGLFLKYYNNGFNFYDENKILSNDELYVKFSKYLDISDIEECKIVDAGYAYKSKYYRVKIINGNYGKIKKMKKCDNDEKCLIHALCQNVKHYHRGSNILVMNARDN